MMFVGKVVDVLVDGSFSGSFAIALLYPDCTPNHPFVDPVLHEDSYRHFSLSRNFSFCDRPGR